MKIKEKIKNLRISFPLVIVVAVVLIILVLFIFLIIVGLSKLNKSTEFVGSDIVSFQISLLEIILTAVTFGAGILGFVGWREIKTSIKENVVREMNSFKVEIKKRIEEISEPKESFSKNQKDIAIGGKQNLDESTSEGEDKDDDNQ